MTTSTPDLSLPAVPEHVAKAMEQLRDADEAYKHRFQPYLALAICVAIFLIGYGLINFAVSTDSELWFHAGGLVSTAGVIGGCLSGAFVRDTSLRLKPGLRLDPRAEKLRWLAERLNKWDDDVKSRSRIGVTDEAFAEYRRKIVDTINTLQQQLDDQVLGQLTPVAPSEIADRMQSDPPRTYEDEQRDHAHKFQARTEVNDLDRRGR